MEVGLYELAVDSWLEMGEVGGLGSGLSSL